MVKVIVFLPRRSDLSREEFEDHIRRVHLPLLVKMPGLRRLSIAWAMHDPDGQPPPCDAIAEDWFDDAAAFGAALASPEGQAVAADAANYLDMSRFGILIGSEEEIRLPAAATA
jgi:uncharacterized protein (TIGR02118 family)